MVSVERSVDDCACVGRRVDGSVGGLARYQEYAARAEPAVARGLVVHPEDEPPSPGCAPDDQDGGTECDREGFFE